jgi:hypothetical protein
MPSTPRKAPPSSRVILQPAWYRPPLDLSCDAPGVTAKRVPRNARALCGATRPLLAPARAEMDTSRMKADVPDYLGYQRAALNFIIPLRDALLLHVPGAGKTRVALDWGLEERGVRLVYITRAGALLSVRSEIQKWTTASVQLLRGVRPWLRRDRVPGKRAGKTKWGTVQVPDSEVLGNADILLTSYETLWAWVPYLTQFLEVGSYRLVLDEIHRVKGWRREGPRNANTGWRPWDAEGKVDFAQKPNLAWSIKQVSLRARGRLGATGSPVGDRPRDLWAQLDLVEPAAWGSNYEFVTRYCDAHPGAWGGLDTTGVSNAEELAARMATMSHRVSVAEARAALPPKRRSVLRIPSEDLLELEDLPEEIQEAARVPALARSLAMQLGIVGARKAPAVCDRVQELFAEDPTRKVVVFTYLRADAERLANSLTDSIGDDLPIWLAHGGHSQEERAEIQRAYMEAPAGLLIATGDSMGESIDLQDTDVAILASLPFNGGRIAQQEGRFTRTGQKRPVEIVYCVAEGTADERVATLLLDKLSASEGLEALGNGAGVAEALEKALGFGDEAQTQKLMELILEG